MVNYLLRRLGWALLTILLAVLIVFVALRLQKVSPVEIKFGQHVVPEAVEEAKEAEGWNRPLYVQFADFLYRLIVHQDLGKSFMTKRDVATDLVSKFSATLELTLAALVIAIPLGILAGVAAAVWRNQWPDYLGMVIALFGVSVPVFFLGMCLMIAFRGWFPVSEGRLPVYVDWQGSTDFYLLESLLRGQFSLFLTALHYLTLPAIALSTIPMAYIARITRASMLDVLAADYVRTAKAKGNAAWRVVLRHALPNASIPIVNIAGLQIGALLSGAVLTETVFRWPGLGTYLVDAVQNHDYNEVQGGVLLVAVCFVSLNLAVDLLYVWFDPRVRLESVTDG